MELKIKDIAELLQVPEKTIYKWIQEGKLPAYKINNQYRFNKSEINDWILTNRVKVSSKVIDLSEAKRPVSLVKLLKNSGIFYDTAGENVVDVIKNAVKIIHTPKDIDKDSIIYSLIQREEMMPTAIGRGIAIPHPRNPIISDIENENLSICFLKNKVDFKAIDGEHVHTLFIVLSANSTRHLEILSKISFLCHKNQFIEFLKNKSPEEEIFSYIENKEKEWSNK
jgi:PTS system nitrogen regulatory IIA component